MTHEALKRPPAVGHAIKGGDLPEPSRTPKPPPTSNAVVDNGSSIILDHIAAFVFGSAFGFVVGVIFVGIGRLL